MIKITDAASTRLKEIMDKHGNHNLYLKLKFEGFG